MKAFHRLHALRMENDAAGYAMDEMRPRFDRMAGRHENGTAPRALAVPLLFQTPPGLAARLVELLSLQPGARVLEPSAGLGRLLDALKPYRPAEVVAVDVCADCTRELFGQERAGVTIKQRDFMTLDPSEVGLFDAVAMNPPFRMWSDIRHIKHALTFLKPGCTLAALCMDGPRQREKLKPIADTWEEIPAGTFKEAGTNIPTALLTLKR